MNCIQVIGRITKTPELRCTPTGKKVCTFAVAVRRDYKNKETDEYETDFFNVCVWEAKAEFVVKRMHKGERIGLSGKMQTRQYTDKNGNPATWYEIIADGIYFADGKQENSGVNTPPPPSEPPQYTSPTNTNSTYNVPPPTEPPQTDAQADFTTSSDDDYPF